MLKNSENFVLKIIVLKNSEKNVLKNFVLKNFELKNNSPKNFRKTNAEKDFIIFETKYP